MDKCVTCGGESECFVRLGEGNYEPYCYPDAKTKIFASGTPLEGILTVFRHIPERLEVRSNSGEDKD